MLELLLSGGAGGLLGGFFTGIFNIINRHQDRQDKAMQYAHEVSLQRMQLESLRHETEREVMLAETNASASTMVSSHEHDASIGETSRWVNNAIKMFRPLITVYLITLTAAVYFSTDHPHIEEMVTEAVIFSCVASIAWWFGDRGLTKMIANNRTPVQQLPWLK